MKIRTERRFGRHHYEAVLEDEFGFSVFGANSYGQTAKEARKALEKMIVQTMKNTGKNVYAFVETETGTIVFHLYNVRGCWEYAIVRPCKPPSVTILGSDVRTQEQALQFMVSDLKHYPGKIIGFAPDYFKDTLGEEKKEKQEQATSAV